MLLAQLQLARRAHHAVRFDSAHRAILSVMPIGRHHRAGLVPSTPTSPGARIGRAADDGQHLLAGIDRQHLQLVGLRMGLGVSTFATRNPFSFSPGFSTPSTSRPTRVSASMIGRASPRYPDAP
jgi:hypothetical protein